MKERIVVKELSKKKLAHQSNPVRSKLPQHFNQLPRYMLPKKSQGRVSSSLLDSQLQNYKTSYKQLNSLSVFGKENIGQIDGRPAKSASNRSKKNIGHCWSQSHIIQITPPSKLYNKYRKSTSSAQMRDDIISKQQHKRKLSLVDEKFPADYTGRNLTSEKLSLTIWIILIRKLFVDENKKRNVQTIKMSLLVNYLSKLEKSGLEDYRGLVQVLDYQKQITKDQLLSLIQQHFLPNKQIASETVKDSIKIAYFDVLNCLALSELKASSNHHKHKSSSSEQHEEVVETARFQQGNIAQELKRNKKYSQNKAYPGMNLHYVEEQNSQQLKQNKKLILNMFPQLQKSRNSSLYQSKDCLNPSLSSFHTGQSKICEMSSKSLIHDQSESALFKKGSFRYQNIPEDSIGRLTLLGKSPRQLMESSLFESMQHMGLSFPKNNISFSLDQLYYDPQMSFQQTVSSIQGFLRQLKSANQDTSSLNSFLQQLIKYRLGVSSDVYAEDGFSYFVSLQKIGSFSEHSQKLLRIVLQSKTMREYFYALQGLKVSYCPSLIHHLIPYFHHNLRILNLSHNKLKNLDRFIQDMPLNSQIELINVNHNQFSEINAFLGKFNKLKQFHCQHNQIACIPECLIVTQQLTIMDLQMNIIAKQSDLIGLAGIVSLQLVNIAGNPIVKQNWKSQWKGLINSKLIYDMSNLYIMSSFGNQKDIAFSTVKVSPREPNKESSKQNSVPIRPKETGSVGDDKQAPECQKYKHNEMAKNSSKAKDKNIRQCIPKQKISKIKTLIDGRVIQ